MQAKRKGNIYHNDWVQIGLVLLALLALIMFSLIMIQTMVNKRFLMDAIFLSLSLGGALIGFITSRIEVRKKTSLGQTRKQIFFEFVNKVCLISVVLFILEIYYALMNKWINRPVEDIWTLMDVKKILLLVLLFAIFSFFGMLFGMIVSKKWMQILLLLVGISISIGLLLIEVSFFALMIAAIGLPFLIYLCFMVFLKHTV